MAESNTTAPRAMTDTSESFMEGFAHFNDPLLGWNTIPPYSFSSS